MRVVKSILLTASLLTMWCQPASAQSLGYSSYSVKVQATGSVTDSNGVQGATRVGVGLYNVDFSRPLIDCVYVGTINSNNAGLISVIRSGGNRLRISTFSSSGAPRDTAFNVLVSCAS